MSCKINWSDRVLSAVLPKTWVTTEYRKHCKDISLDREKSFIPETLTEIPRFREEEKQKKILKDLLDRRKALTDQIHDIRSKKYPDKQAKPNFICPCPKEDCRGMIESINFKCGVCDTKICRKCRMQLKEKHKHRCTDEDIEAVKFLRKDTKACPKCATPIFKIDGCDQMWCTQCRTAFSWKTGIIETKRIHNPHAIEWRRAHGNNARDIHDIPCGGMPEYHQLTSLQIGRVKLRMIDQIIRAVDDSIYIMERYQPQEFDNIRREYVLDKITEDQWKQRIFLRERTNTRKQAILDIIDTFRTLIIERVKNFYESSQENGTIVPAPLYDQFIDSYESSNAPLYDQFIKEVEEIKTFINDTLNKELKALGTTKPIQITENWNWMLNSKILC
uniref:E3 ubiquitin-protein ligase n=1 Tax=Marseillevirus LCMAC102 TaxID=2506603 RepID=A0A481YUS7_9VIRU|nr:MAG: E3 ubiquitin-protein ligase [Marseillevirus LCMAC102]